MIGKISAAALAAALMSVTSLAQAQEAPSSAQPSAERVNLVIVYGEDACPPSNGQDIVVCGRQEEKDRYRIPEPLRADPNAAVNQAWGERFKSIEYVGREGIESCSPVGGGGATGCFAKISKQAKAEKQQAANADWGDLVAAERAKRLGRIDAESEAIEQRVKAEEKAEAAATATVPAPAPQ